MARKQPQPGVFDPGEIPMSVPQQGAPAPVQVQQPQDQPVYTEQEMIEHGELARLMTRKEVVLKILHEKALHDGEITIANTLAFIMADYKFISLNPEQKEE